MKKTLFAIMLLAATASLQTSFRDDKKETATEGYAFIDVDPARLTPTDTLALRLYIEAFKRVDEFIEFEDYRFVLKINNGACVGISEELFEYFKDVMNQTNARIKGRPYRQVNDRAIELLPLDTIIYEKRK